MSTVPFTPQQEKVNRRDQALSWFSPLNLHLIGAAALLILVLYLVVHALVLWSSTGAAGEQAMSDARAQQVVAELAARPLRGLDEKLALSQKQANAFVETRLPYAYSNVAAELGALAKQDNVRMARVQYVQAPSANGLTEVRMDAQLTGDYRSLAHFLNGLERDKSFFLIGALGLSGQQSGMVNLRVRIVTYLREPMPVNAASTGGAQ